jgi:hypothetical protein
VTGVLEKALLHRERKRESKFGDVLPQRGAVVICRFCLRCSSPWYMLLRRGGAGWASPHGAKHRPMSMTSACGRCSFSWVPAPSSSATFAPSRMRTRAFGEPEVAPIPLDGAVQIGDDDRGICIRQRFEPAARSGRAITNGVGLREPTPHIGHFFFRAAVFSGHSRFSRARISRSAARSAWASISAGSNGSASSK